MKRTLYLAVGISGLSAVAFGAFGAHGLKPLLDTAQLGMYEKAVAYQFYHTLAAFFALSLLKSESYSNKAALMFLIGIILFSGSLYLLSTRHISGLPGGFLGPITPLGGISFMAGWLLLMIAVIRNES